MDFERTSMLLDLLRQRRLELVDTRSVDDRKDL
jgi:hypothetical protein